MLKTSLETLVLEKVMFSQHQVVCTIISDGSLGDYAEVEAAISECLAASCDNVHMVHVEYKGCREMTATGVKIYGARKKGVKAEKTAPRKPAKFVKPVA